MTLSKKQKIAGTAFDGRFFYIHERDLLAMAQEKPAWRSLARYLGFDEAKIAAPWPHPDPGRRIRYMEIETRKLVNGKGALLGLVAA